ncbi:hypothetical protein [Maritalea sp.]|uniref:hypothetical protein n=1 Tax=Maritalea sp. TaxID=2003361 RepID=UPI003EF85D4B
MSLLFPSTDQSDKPFDRFARRENGKLKPFHPRMERQDDQLFYASLASIRDDLMRSATVYSKRGELPLQMDVGFIESGLPNAFVNKHHNAHIAAIHTGLAVTIHEFSLFCFAQASFLPMIGKPDLEISPAAVKNMPPGVALLLATRKADAGQEFADRFIMPQCPHRVAAAHYLSLLMMRFVWFHEIGHGILGHVDYLKSLSQNQQIDLSELYMSELTDVSALLDGRALQCMEFEADGWALGKLIAGQIEGAENIQAVAGLHLALRLQMSLFAAFSLCWLMETLASTAKRGRLNITHPAPVRRLHMLDSIARRELRPIKMESDRMVTDVLANFDKVLAQIGEQWHQTDHFDPLGHREVFDAMRDELTPFRYHSAS